VSLVIGRIPIALSEKLVEEYLEIKKRFLMNDWGPGQLKGGRFAEALLRIYQYLLGEAVTPFGEDISAFAKTRILNAVQNHPSIDDHIRQKSVPIARLLLDFRNNRDVAHLGGFNANSMDTLFVTTAATWTLCEFVRVYGGYEMGEAEAIVESLSVKEYPVIIERNGEIFLARHDLKARQEVLVLLTKNPEATFDFLFSKTRDRNKTRFKKTLDEMVSEKLVGVSNGNYFLMPRGMSTVSKDSLLRFTP